MDGGIGGERFVDGGEVAVHAGAVVVEWAAGVDEGDEDDLAFELIEVDGVAVLVEERQLGIVAGAWGTWYWTAGL